MKITHFSTCEPFTVYRDKNLFGVAIGWALTSEGYAVPVFTNPKNLQHGDVFECLNTNVCIGDPKKAGELLFGEDGPEETKGPGRPPKEKNEPLSMGPWDIGFGDKTYKLTSSWHFKDGDTEFVFQIPGDSDTPDDERVTKITRDKFAELSRTAGKKSYDDVIGNNEIPSAEDEDGEDAALDLV